VRAAHQSDAAFNFSYTYRGLNERRQVPLRLPVHSLNQAPFSMKGDPYKFGRAIQNPADFYGREKEIKKLLSSLARGGHTNFLLQGPRRMGKTSTLYMLKHALVEPHIRRRFDIPPQWDDALNQYRPVMLDLQASHFQDDRVYVTRFFRTLLRAVSNDIAPRLCDELLQNFDQRQQEIGTPRAVLEQLRRVFDHQPRARAVVLLDEYDELYRPQGRALDMALRHVVQAEQRLTWIIVSTQFLFKEGKSHGSPWFNILDIIELDCLSSKAAQRLIEEPSRNEQVEWQSNAIVALLDETGGHPAFLQLFCSRVMSHLNQERQNYVLSETIATLAEQIVQEQETIHSHFEFYWTDTPGVGRLILLAADESDRPPSRLALQRRVQTQLQANFGPAAEKRVPDARGDPVPWWEQEFQDGMAWVSRVVNAIQYDRASRAYTFTVPLFRRWLQHKRRHEDLQETALHKVATEMERDELV
jgi:DNA polymerase III delta prime subunit